MSASQPRDEESKQNSIVADYADTHTLDAAMLWLVEPWARTVTSIWSLTLPAYHEQNSFYRAFSGLGEPGPVLSVWAILLYWGSVFRHVLDSTTWPHQMVRYKIKSESRQPEDRCCRGDTTLVSITRLCCYSFVLYNLDPSFSFKGFTSIFCTLYLVLWLALRSQLASVLSFHLFPFLNCSPPLSRDAGPPE